MKIMVNTMGDGLKLRLSGAFDITCVRDAKEKFGPILEMKRDLLVDLSAIAKIDTAAIQLLMLVKREAGRNGIGCQFVHPTRETARALDLIHLPGLAIGPAASA